VTEIQPDFAAIVPANLRVTLKLLFQNLLHNSPFTSMPGMPGASLPQKFHKIGLPVGPFLVASSAIKRTLLKQPFPDR
jgi:Asp-tRNA(Asn)/Glu-tRNA(Gln) amidotransferase A subunit family amidase